MAGSFFDDDHAGVFFAQLLPAPGRSDGGLLFVMKLMDPHAVVTFDDKVLTKLNEHLRKVFDEVAGEGRVRIKIEFVPVEERLALQYAYEGSCGPSSLALLMSMMRLAKKTNTSAGPLPPAFAAQIFRGVSEEEVVLAVQLVHHAVV